jgi:hypothetical protein
VNVGRFIDNPRGSFEMQLLGCSKMSRFDETAGAYQGLVVRVTKQVSKQIGDQLVYLLNNDDEH